MLTVWRMQSNIKSECGWQCKNCEDQSGLHLHVEIENLKQRLLEREHHIVSMETNFLNEAEKFPNGEFSALNEELLTWQEKYSRLYDSHKRVQKVNQGLEDKLLRIVDKFETEKNSLTRDLGSVTQRLVESRAKVKQLEDENERYKNDVNLAIQLLQCKPSNFVSQKIDSLSPELQHQVRSYMISKRTDGNGSSTPKAEPRIIKVPIPTFPPTAMVYSLNKSAPPDVECGVSGKQPVDIVSAAIMAKVLEERARERLLRKHCDTCTCSTQLDRGTDRATQTPSEQLSSPIHRGKMYGSDSSGSVSMIVGPSVAPSLGATRNIDSMKLSESNLLFSTDDSNSDCFRRDDKEPFDRLKFNGDKYSAVKVINNANVTRKVVKPTKKTASNTLHSTRDSSNDDVIWSSLSSSSGSPVSNQVRFDIEREISDVVPEISRDVFYDRADENRRLRSYLGKTETTRVRNREGRTFLSDEINNKSNEVYKAASPNKSPETMENKAQRKSAPGPRPCSLRMQAGTSNILLANATCYTPVLYTSRPDVLVHSPRSRSASASSTDNGAYSSSET